VKELPAAPEVPVLDPIEEPATPALAAVDPVVDEPAPAVEPVLEPVDPATPAVEPVVEPVDGVAEAVDPVVEPAAPAVDPLGVEGIADDPLAPLPEAMLALTSMKLPLAAGELPVVPVAPVVPAVDALLPAPAPDTRQPVTTTACP
jgi:hypothetical protein